MSWTTCTRTLEQLGLVLPTEAQWEYGARGGTSSPWWTGDSKESLSGAANLADRYGKEHGAEGWVGIEEWLDDGNTSHARVASYRANPFGLFEVHGNVWEWCRDGYDGNFYGQRADRDPFNPPEGSSNRVYRGGGFGSDASRARSANRSNGSPSSAVANQGVRPARTIAP